MNDNRAAHEPEQVKVFFEPPDDPAEDWHTQVESMFAFVIDEPEAPDGRVYKLDNSPWYVFGVSYEDQVCAESRHEVFEKPEHFECDVLYFTKVWKHSGNSTYTLFLLGGRNSESQDWKEYWEQLKQVGCTYEGMNGKVFSVNVPREADLDQVEAIFEDALEREVFAYQTQHRFSAEKLLN